MAAQYAISKVTSKQLINNFTEIKSTTIIYKKMCFWVTQYLRSFEK